MSVCFAFSSCQYPAGFLDRTVAEASYRRLGALLDRGGPDLPQCLLLLGDQVYVDATAGLFDPTTRHDRFVRPYQRLFQMKPMQDVLRRLPAMMMLDDHEIEDNWEPVEGDQALSAVLEQGRQSYLDFGRLAGQAPADPQGDSRQPLWYDFEIDGTPFFMADTRTERTARTAATIGNARIMSEAQFERLLGWLDAHKAADVPKFIASPAILLPRRLRATYRNHPASALRSDAWDGYPYSLHRLLAHIAEQEIRNVVFLSGDEHLSCLARARVTAPSGRSALVHSIHSSPLYGPFPFADSRPADLAGDETFRFGVAAARYTCAVDTEFAAPGDGFAVLQALKAENGAWRLRCTFDRASGSQLIERDL